MAKKLSQSFKSVADSSPTIGRPRIPSDVVVLRVGNLNHTPQLQVRIGTDVMKQMSWRVGDMVSLSAGTVEGGHVALRIQRSDRGTHRLVGQSSQDRKMVCAWVRLADKAIMDQVQPLLGRHLRPQVCGGDLYVVHPSSLQS